jgi:hypothetical protein
MDRHRNDARISCRKTEQEISMLQKASISSQPLYVNDVMKAVVAATTAELLSDSASWLSVNNKSINFQYGDKDEISKQMQLLSQGKDTKSTTYPMLCLVMPYAQNKGVEYASTVSLPQIIIATRTGQNESYDKRYTDYIKPVLYPVYKAFLHQLAMVANITNYGDPNHIPHKLTEMPNIQTKDSGLNDYIDALVLTEVQVTFINSQINTF